MAADATDPLEAASAELEVERLRTLLADDVATMEGLLLVGTAGLATESGISRERARQAALAARLRLQLVALIDRLDALEPLRVMICAAAFARRYDISETTAGATYPLPGEHLIATKWWL